MHVVKKLDHSLLLMFHINDHDAKLVLVKENKYKIYF